ncbi:PQQ-binding-like beta-propeller repeat protein, partial [bacterium]|nr:PQQ-binding-like beta-propeller repeat protein [bacterium]
MQTKFPTVGLRRPALLLFLIAASATWAATAKPDPALAAQARKLLADSGVQGGLVVHLGCGAGALTAALRVDGRYLVHGLDPDPANVQAARTHIRSLGLYGPVSVAPLTGKRLPYTSDLVNLLVVSGAHGVSQAEMLRVLAPRGVALRRKGYGWMPTVKPCPDDVDDWTHLWHGPDNNGVAMDARVGPPRHLKWKSAPLWCRSHDGVPLSVPIVLSANGRLLSLIDEGLTGQPSLPQRWTLVMRDGYNGVLLWRKRLPGRVSTKALAAVGDRVYLIPNRRSPLTVLDAATGKPLMTCAGTENANEFVCSAGIVALHAKGARKSSDGKDSVILGVDAKTGKTLWKTPSAPVTPETLTATDDAVFAQTGKSLVCLGLRDGAQRWTVPVKGSGKGGALMVYRGAVIASPSGALQVYAAEDGKLLWKGPRANKRLGVFGASGLVWVTSINEGGRTFLWTPAPTVSSGRDPRTGEVKRTVSVPFLASPGHHIRCYSAKATDRYLLLPKRGVEFVDLQGENHMRHDWLRGSCRHGVIAANGLLYAPPHQCFCYPGVKLAGYNAVSADVGEETAPAGEALERGPAYGKLTTRNSQLTTPSDWPMYRHDARRSGRAACDVPPSPQTLWKRDLSGVLTQPIVADGRLVVADKDAHTIHCMAADTGKDLWTHVAGGRIDSPPTGHRGAVLFGSTDGFVTCLRASDGVVAWRFRAAPRDRRIVVFDQLES